MNYFKHLPKLQYNNTLLTNIVVRAKIKDVVRNHVNVLYPYFIKEGERPDIIANKYYGSSQYTWFIFYTNDIVDPLFEWPLDTDAFNAFIKEKYGSIEASTQRIYHYYNEDGLILDEESWLALPEVDRRILYAYDYEHIVNEKKRSINLVDNAYTQQIMEEFKSVFR